MWCNAIGLSALHSFLLRPRSFICKKRKAHASYGMSTKTVFHDSGPNTYFDTEDTDHYIYWWLFRESDKHKSWRPYILLYVERLFIISFQGYCCFLKTQSVVSWKQKKLHYCECKFDSVPLIILPLLQCSTVQNYLKLSKNYLNLSWKILKASANLTRCH